VTPPVPERRTAQPCLQRCPYLCRALAALLLAGCAHQAAAPEALSAAALARAMAGHPIVLLGEVHDNAAQHALRVEALHLLVAGGARPALAFEQLDRDKQPLIDAVRRRVHGSVDQRVHALIEAAGGRGWDWDLYAPYLKLALQWDLPIVAANLSRREAMRVAEDGPGSVFDAAQRRDLGLDTVAPDIERAQEHEIELGHCGRLPADAMAPMAAAQIARDAVLAAAIAPYADRGVVLLTGNGHARRDIGVPRHLSERDRARTVSIGLLEGEPESAAAQPPAGPAASFDVAFVSAVQSRADPCADFHHTPMGGRPGGGADAAPGAAAPAPGAPLPPADPAAAGPAGPAAAPPPR